MALFGSCKKLYKWCNKKKDKNKKFNDMILRSGRKTANCITWDINGQNSKKKKKKKKGRGSDKITKLVHVQNSNSAVDKHNQVISSTHGISASYNSPTESSAPDLTVTDLSNKMANQNTKSSASVVRNLPSIEQTTHDNLLNNFLCPVGSTSSNSSANSTKTTPKNNFHCSVIYTNSSSSVPSTKTPSLKDNIPLIVDVTNIAKFRPKSKRKDKKSSVVSIIIHDQSGSNEPTEPQKTSHKRKYGDLSSASECSCEQKDEDDVISIPSDDEVVFVESEDTSKLKKTECSDVIVITPPVKRPKVSSEIPIIDLCTPNPTLGGKKISLSQKKKRKQNNFKLLQKLKNTRHHPSAPPLCNASHVVEVDTNQTTNNTGTKICESENHTNSSSAKTSESPLKPYTSILGTLSQRGPFPNSSATATSCSSVSANNMTPKSTGVDLAGVPSPSMYGNNLYNPNPVARVGLRPIVIDGSNVAFGHANGAFFSSRGLKICINYFLKRNHKVIAFVPLFRRSNSSTKDPQILDELDRQGLLSFTPSRRLHGRLVVPYDDRYIVQYAAESGGVIVSTDNFRDLLCENQTWKETIERRLLMFTWAGDILMFPQDPLGRNGPNLERFLRFP